jgi:hypothetical protein
MATKKEVVKKQSTEIMVGDLGSLEDFAGQGTENISIQDIKLPEIKCASKTTPEVDEDNPKYIEGCKIGDIFNNTTKSVYQGYKRENKGVLAIPCHFYLNWVEWSKLGTGSVAPENVYSNNSIMAKTSRKPASEKDYKDYLPNGNYVAETANHFVLLLDEDFQPIEQGLIRMAATQRKKSKLWNTMITSKKMKGKNGDPFRPPSWAGVYRLTTCKEENDMGPWTGWVINFERMLDQTKDAKTLQAAHKFCQDAKNIDMSSSAAEDPSAAESVVVEAKKADADFEDDKVLF